MRETDVSKLNLNNLKDLFFRLTTVSNYRYSGHYKGYYRHHSRFNFEDSVFISYLNKTYDLEISIENTYYYSPCTIITWDYNHACNKLANVKFEDFKNDFLIYYEKVEKRCYVQFQIFMICLTFLSLYIIVWYLFLRD